MLEEYLKNIIAVDKLAKQEAEMNHALYRYGNQKAYRENYNFIRYLIKNFEQFEVSKDLFANEESKKLFNKLLLYKSLGFEYVKLPTNTYEYQKYVKTVDSNPYNIDILEQNVLPLRHKYMNQYYIREYDFQVLTSNGFLINILFNKQYIYDLGTQVTVEKDDVVLDCGACWGDTSLLFSKLCGENGKVLAFEFEESNLNIFRQNLLHNISVNNITIIEKALDSTSDTQLSYQSNMNATNLNEGGNCSIDTITIDDAVNKEKLAKVDFIKMDIEGFELNALQGAINTIKKYKPKLAISLYHKYDDFITIPQWIKANFPEYKFYLGHHTIHSEETVLYAKV